MRALRLAFLLIVMGGTAAFAALQFPALTGRVVDDAHVLSPATVASLDQMLADYERGTTNQVVVVTLPSLQGDSIEDYGYQLGRAWQIGQKGKNNGALLIVVPSEHKVRIEVGYGLEPVLTDAASSAIVQGVIVPRLREGHMEQGVVDGTQAMLSVLGGKGVAASVNASSNEMSTSQAILLIFFLVFLGWLSIRHPFMAWWLLSNFMRFGSSRVDSGWSGGGFSGGGGSFGGGGASGSW